jgi:imidazolonepropionase-like amidohydrolase
MLTALLAVSAMTLAQDLAPKAPAQSVAVTLYNAHVHPVSAPDMPTGFVTFSNGKITEIGPGPVHVPAPFAVKDHTFVDLKGAHVYPGLVGAFTQLGLTEIQAVRPTNDLGEVGGVTPEVLALTAVNPDTTLLPVTRANGVLSAGVFPTGGLIPGRPSAIRLDGWTNHDLAYAAPHADSSLGLLVNWPNVRPIRAFFIDKSDEEQMKEIRATLDRLALVFDTARSYHQTREQDQDTPVDLRWEAMGAIFPGAKNAKPLPVFVAAADYDQIQSAVTFFAERKMRMVLVGGRDAGLCAELLKRHDIPVIVTGTHVLPRRSDSAYDEPYTLPARLHAAGVRFCIASADDTAHERNLPYNAAMAAAHGLPISEAIRSVTLSPAQILGIDAFVGSLETGKQATLLITDGNPLEVTTRITGAYIDGKAISLESKHSALAEKYRERYRQLGQLKNAK